MKQFKPVIITAVVLVIIAAAAFAAVKLIPAADDGGDVNGDGILSEGSIRIIDRSSQDVESVEITTDSGEVFVIDYAPDSTGSRVGSMRGADKLLKYNEDEMTTLSGYVGLLTAVDEVGEGNDADYGFDTPKRILDITFKGGEKKRLLIGDETPLGTGIYVKLADKGTIYTIGGMTMSVLMKTKQDYRDFTLFDKISSSDDITRAELLRAGKETLAVVRKADADETLADSTQESLRAKYEITSPIKCDASPDTVGSAFLDKIIAISALELAEDYPKNLKQYGLENPAKIKFSAHDGQEVTLLVGDRAPSGGRYVMREGVPSVVITENDIDFLNISHVDIMTKLIFFYNSSEVKSIDYALGGKNHTLALSIKDNSLTGVLDGKTLEGKNATNLFLRTVRFTAAGEAVGARNEQTEVRITITLKNGKKKTLELCRMNERQYSAKIDGKKAQFIVGVDEVHELTEAFELLSKGENIPDMF